MLYILGALPTAFWIWMIYDCLQSEVDRDWIWVVIFLYVPGALLYFFARAIHRMQIHVPALGFIGGLGTRREIQQARADARSIGNPRHFVALGDAYLKAARYQEAGLAYGHALDKAPDDLYALWGAACVDLHGRDWAPAADRLRKILAADPRFKFGEASLALARALLESGQVDEARAQLETHDASWSHPEAGILMAGIHAERGETEQARARLERVIHGLEDGPDYFRKKNRHWLRRARSMHRRLG